VMVLSIIAVHKTLRPAVSIVLSKALFRGGGLTVCGKRDAGKKITHERRGGRQ